MIRKCNACGIEKDLSEFYNDKSRVLGKSYTCKECKNSHSKTYQSSLGKEDYDIRGILDNKKRRQRYYSKHKDTSIRDYSYSSRYGISLVEYNLMYENQNGLCCICGKKKDKLVVDHNHKTGKVRGLLCSKCNSGLGMFCDDKDVIIKAIKYMEKNDD